MSLLTPRARAVFTAVAVTGMSAFSVGAAIYVNRVGQSTQDCINGAPKTDFFQVLFNLDDKGEPRKGFAPVTTISCPFPR